MKKRVQISDDVRRKMKQIEIHTRRILTGSLVGDTRSALKGTGFEFDQIREYQMGDDVRFIDWRASARMNTVLVKQYVEERSRTIMLVVDISASSFFSSTRQGKYATIAEVASVLALVAGYGNDCVGLVLFSDEVEQYIPPRRGRFHARRIMEVLFGCTGSKKTTDINCALRYVAQLKRKDAIVFMVSDFIDEGFEQSLSSVVSRSEVVAIRCCDNNEWALPAVGLVEVQDIETGENTLMDMRRGHVDALNTFLQTWRDSQDRLFKKNNIDRIDVVNSRPFMGDLIRFFRRRMRY